MMDPTPPQPGSKRLPRELVLASAGTGKTYTLSGRIISLLAAGAPPETLLASTFTRKAAGEILSRVLARLAKAGLSEVEAGNLARETTTGIIPPGEADSDFFLRLLRALILDLHRLNIGTLDSFFLRIARGFSPDLGLPPGWSITDEPGALKLEAEALQAILDGASRAQTVEVIRMAMRGDWGRGVHSRLLDQLRSLRELIHQLDPQGGGDPWGPSGGPQPSVTPEERAAAAEALTSVPIPTTKSGTPHKGFQGAVDSAVAALREGDWETFCSKGPASSVLKGQNDFYRKEIPEAMVAALRVGLALAERALASMLSKQASALAALAGEFDETLSRLQRAQGAFRFQDITFLIGGPDPMGLRSDIWYRLDQQARHILLDEFQDTSLAQWEALQPLANELLSGHLEDRSATIVADPKQSIYGWRGADPLLVGRVGDTYAFSRRTLERSFRSSEPVLEFVNRVFMDLPSNPVWNGSEEKRRQAELWARGFTPHRAAREIPGHVRVLAGPRDEHMRRADRPRMMAWAADRVVELVSEAPGATVGILVRQNAAVARLIMELRARGVQASEEGASTLEDSPAVSTLLALLRLADHPGDTLAAYQTLHSPLAKLFQQAPASETGWAQNVASEVRRTLLPRGYGATLTSWIRALGEDGALGHRDLQRLLQLTELAYRWDSRATLRPGDFVRFVQAERMEAPSAAPVRVMTVHQAKGLEFDQVVLPELDLPLTRGRGRFGGVVPLRNPDSGRVVRILPRVPGELRALIPELEEATLQEAGSELRDALGVLYVAMTRARHALHLFVAEDPDPGKVPPTFSGLLLGGLDLGESTTVRDQVLLELGDPRWMEKTDLGTALDRTGARRGGESSESPRPRLARKGVRSRNLHHRTPSSLEAPARQDLRSLLSLERADARRTGSLIHGWLQELTWIEEWDPDRERLLAQAGRLAPGMPREDVVGHLARLGRWLEAEEVRRCLSRAAYPRDAQVRTEYPFAIALEGAFFNGLVDRVVLVKEDGVPRHAHVLDFKTDAVSPGDEKALADRSELYRPQLEVYRKAMTGILRLDDGTVTADLVFLLPGRVVRL